MTEGTNIDNWCAQLVGVVRFQSAYSRKCYAVV